MGICEALCDIACKKDYTNEIGFRFDVPEQRLKWTSGSMLFIGYNLNDPIGVSLLSGLTNHGGIRSVFWKRVELHKLSSEFFTIMMT